MSAGPMSTTRDPNARAIVTLLVMFVALAGSPFAHAATQPAPAAHGATAKALTPAQALERLEAGNRRYTSGAPTHPNQSAARRTEEAQGQHPYAVIVSCSDSRVPPEIVLDEGLGDLFVIRTAGNRLDDLVLASIEYAVDHLGTSLVVVMGHERCGAIAAAVEAPTAHASPPPGGAPEPNHVPVLVHTLSDAVTASAGQPGDKAENAMLENVRIVVRGVGAESPYLAARIKAGALRVVGARYDLDTGVVTLVGPAGSPAASK